ncbi:MAG: Ig-like domain-containing protein [Bacteroidota bacterium]
MKILKTFSILAILVLFSWNIQAQSISFSSPMDGASFDAPHDLYVLVETTGNIRKVTLFLDGDRVRDEKVAPYEWGAAGQNDPLLQEMTDGNYTLRAVAEVRGGSNIETSISITIGDPNIGGGDLSPVVSFEQPTAGENFDAPADVFVLVNASSPDADGKVSKVDLYLDDRLVRTEGRAPYEWGKATQSDDELKNMSYGTYVLKAKATDNSGRTGEATLTFTVGNSTGNLPPTLSISTPSAGQTFQAGDNLNIAVDASDPDGNIAMVDFRFNDRLSGQDASAPYTWTIANLEVGTHELKVTARDDEGAETTLTMDIIVRPIDNGEGDTWQYSGSTAFYEGGFVGIGTDNPDEMLTVAGIIHSREVVVTVAAGADFVFEKDYELLPLDELAAYLETNKHLPEIAPAKEMEKDGLALSEFNIQLLQKVEELTLYTIELHERYKALEELVIKMQQEKSEEKSEQSEK